MTFREFSRRAYHKIRVKYFRLISECRNVSGEIRCKHPVQFNGSGTIEARGPVQFGYYPSPYYFTGYSYVEARGADAKISIGGGTTINNNFVCIATKSITIGEGVLVGTNVQISDSDFHSLSISERHTSSGKSTEVVIGDNVFIGSNVIILKGVHIGDYAVIGSGSVVTKDIPARSIAAGNPAAVIREISH